MWIGEFQTPRYATLWCRSATYWPHILLHYGIITFFSYLPSLKRNQAKKRTLQTTFPQHLPNTPFPIKKKRTNFKLFFSLRRNKQDRKGHIPLHDAAFHHTRRLSALSPMSTPSPPSLLTHNLVANPNTSPSPRRLQSHPHLTDAALLLPALEPLRALPRDVTGRSPTDGPLPHRHASPAPRVPPSAGECPSGHAPSVVQDPRGGNVRAHKRRVQDPLQPASAGAVSSIPAGCGRGKR